MFCKLMDHMSLLQSNKKLVNNIILRLLYPDKYQKIKKCHILFFFLNQP